MIEVRDLRHAEIPAAVAVTARGMRDNPLHLAAYGDDPRRRLSCHARLVGALFEVSTSLGLIGAFRDGVLVAVAGAAPAGSCQPTVHQRLRLLPRLASLGPATAGRVLVWTRTWAGHDLDEPHIHLGPVAVDAAVQGQGLGTRIMRAHCRRLDEEAAIGYLETDKEENVRFYSRFGYEVVGEAPVLGVRNWFMRRG